MAEYIEREAFLSDTTQRYCINCDSYNGVRCRACWVNDMQGEVDDFPAADVLPVTREELKHMMNDTITYIWRLEDREATSPAFGYDSRKALLEKLKKFYAEHFPEVGECAGRMDGAE